LRPNAWARATMAAIRLVSPHKHVVDRALEDVGGAVADRIACAVAVHIAIRLKDTFEGPWCLPSLVCHGADKLQACVDLVLKVCTWRFYEDLTLKAKI